MGLRTIGACRLFSMCSLAAAAAVFLATPGAESAEFGDKAAKAESLLQAGQAEAAFETLEAAIDTFWRQAPLTLADVRIATDQPATAQPVIAPAEPVTVYMEPRGYGFDSDNGMFRVSLSSGTEIRTPGGLILAKSDDAARLEWSGPAKNRAFSGRITIAMPELKPGDYELLLTLTDDATGKVASTTLPFTIAAE